MRKRGIDIFLLVLKILIPVALLVFLVWTTIDLGNQYIDDKNMVCENGDVCVEGYGLTFLAFLVFGFIYNGIVWILSLVGLITSISYKEALNRRKNIITSVLLLIAPIVAELLIVAVFLVLPVILG